MVVENLNQLSIRKQFDSAALNTIFANDNNSSDSEAEMMDQERDKLIVDLVAFMIELCANGKFAEKLAHQPDMIALSQRFNLT